MKLFSMLGLAAGLTCAGAAGASAAIPAPMPVLDNQIMLVSGGCGPGGFRDRFGNCRANRVYAPPPRRVYCPRGTHPTPYGCRRNY